LSRTCNRYHYTQGTKLSLPDSALKQEVLTLFPALLLASEYHQRWEIENTIDELKNHLNGRKTPIRSLKPREVVQEIYGWLLGHYAVRCLMFTAAQQVGISPLRLGFTGTLKVIRRAIPDFQDVQSEQLPFFSPS
jgi:hypothetical protein